MQNLSVKVLIVMGLIFSAPVFALEKEKKVSETDVSYYEALPVCDTLIKDLQNTDTTNEPNKDNIYELKEENNYIEKDKVEFKETYSNDSDDDNDVSEDNDYIISSETANLDEEKKSLPIYLEPFLESSLSHLENNLNNIAELYTFNRQNDKLALAISLVQNKENYVKRGCYEIINLNHLAPYKFIASLNIAVELFAIAEELNLKILKKASERLFIQNSGLSFKNNVLNQLQNDFLIVNEIKSIYFKIINETSIFVNELIKTQNKNAIYAKPMHILRPSNKKIFNIMNDLIDYSLKISDSYESHYDYRNELLDYVISEPASIKNAVIISQISASIYDFINILEQGKNKFPDFISSIDFEIKKLREELNKTINSINLKKSDIEKKFNYYPGYIKTSSSEKGLHIINFSDDIRKIFDLLNKLCDSDLLKDKLASEENITKKRLERIERSDNLLNELLSFVDSNSNNIIENYELLFGNADSPENDKTEKDKKDNNENEK